MDEIALPQFDIKQEDIKYGNCTKYYQGTGCKLCIVDIVTISQTLFHPHHCNKATNSVVKSVASKLTENTQILSCRMSFIFLNWEPVEQNYLNLWGKKEMHLFFNAANVDGLPSSLWHLQCNVFAVLGYYTCVEVIFTLRRQVGFYMMGVYAPTLLIVVLSWLSFWINPDASAARVPLGKSTHSY